MGGKACRRHGGTDQYGRQEKMFFFPCNLFPFPANLFPGPFSPWSLLPKPSPPPDRGESEFTSPSPLPSGRDYQTKINSPLAPLGESGGGEGGYVTKFSKTQ